MKKETPRQRMKRIRREAHDKALGIKATSSGNTSFFTSRPNHGTGYGKGSLK